MQDLLGRPSESVRAQALKMLKKLPTDVGSGKLQMCVARYASIVVCTIVLIGFIHYAASIVLTSVGF